jgi:hypothetical protein
VVVAGRAELRLDDFGSSTAREKALGSITILQSSRGTAMHDQRCEVSGNSVK